MKWYTWWAKADRDLVISEDSLYLIQEIRKARSEWTTAQNRLDYVIEKDQVDYAVYALEAAEKRYEMLLRSAKRMKITLLNEKTGKVAEV
jgi:chemotaxis regulatin CheY-phosphate phosphatase CheZ